MSKARRGGDPSATRTDATDAPRNGVEVLDASPFAGDLDADLAPRPARRKPTPAVFLVAGIVAVAGFIGGVQAHKTWGGSDAATGGAPSASGQRQGGFGGGGGGGLGGVTSGTVTKVKDGVITLKTSDGGTVEVKTGDDTEITLSESGTAADLESGASVVVRGETGDDGVVTATSVSEGSGASGFPGGGGGGGGGGMQAPGQN
ncbi:hypothetical protein [Actinocorallia sp. A-T 12471]|uniref:hypothetical protein n=1 Tax=Actinocorallia sp. A-T 12471 TaxID=3089813 RepID=UPI0029CBCC4B|nr:hypothetical protein [Actinocorallia sp. A-T 12471]MDX6739289.1 hypothetical protein [Actinocorallia sp. A-T 12471]